LFSGVRNAPYRAAMFVGSSILVILAARTSWFWGFGAAGAIMCLVGATNAAIMPHPPERTRASQGGAGERKGAEFLQAYRSFFFQPNAAIVLSFMLFYKLGDIMMFAMSKPLLRDIGVDTAQRGVLNAIGPASQILGSILGGAIIARHGLQRSLVPMTFLQNFAIPLYLGMAIFKPSFFGVIPVVVAEQFAAGIGAAAHVVFLMQRCKTAFSASHYALATSVVSVASTVSGVISGPLNDAVGHVAFFAIAFVASWPSLVLVLFVPKTAVEPAG
jgi:PAT family beta-lactamase induction signal transducer AmpG